MKDNKLNGFEYISNLKIYAKTFEHEAYLQVKELSNHYAYKDSIIRIMPDAHAGKGCTIGTTMTITDKITPNLVGVDISCGMLCINLGCIDVDVVLLDDIINKYIPNGFNIHSTPKNTFSDLNNLKCKEYIDKERAVLSIGSLGGGNHFIELNIDDDNCKYLIIHSGSRHLGVQVCKYYQELAIKLHNYENDNNINKDLCCLYGDSFNDYIHDMKIIQNYADLNRRTISEIILKHLNVHPIESFTTIHNYIDCDKMILRKGAVSADIGEKIIIPMNMRDGSLLCVGKGNKDWNYSAPHGAGRLMSRSKAKKCIEFDEFKESMNGIYSTSICESTIDESPMCYKSMQEIIDCIEPTVDIIKILKPIYNFKSKQ